MKSRRSAAMLILLVAGWTALSAARCMARPPATDLHQEELLKLHLAGLSGDLSLLPKMIDSLENPTYYDRTLTVLQAVARLGAMEALPAIDNIIAENKDPNVAPYDRVARARLLAEHAALAVSDPDMRPKTKVERFYKELNLTPEEINAQIRAYKIEAAEQPRIAHSQPVGARAMADLADMVYRDSGSKAAADRYLRLPGIAGLDFTLLPEYVLKIRLAPLSRDQRIKTMVYELGHETWGAPVPPDDYAKAQLLVDEGIAARPAIVAQMLELYTNRYQHFKHHDNYDSDALQRALQNITSEDLNYELFHNHKVSLTEPGEARIVKAQIVLGY